MADDKKKTGATEAGVAVMIVGILETAQRALGSGDTPLIPDPWGPIILSGLGFAIVVARYFQKRAGA